MKPRRHGRTAVGKSSGGDKNKKMNKGKLYLIPAPLGDNDPAEVLPASVIERACSLRIFVAEELRTARRFPFEIRTEGAYRRTGAARAQRAQQSRRCRSPGRAVRAGRCGAALRSRTAGGGRPGADLVALCHRRGIEVVPLVGPSSLMLALMASGLNGQSFAFCGYVPAKTEERRSRAEVAGETVGGGPAQPDHNRNSLPQ